MNDRDLAYHGLAIKRYATPEAVAHLILRDPSLVVGLLDAAVASGRALKVNDAYTLTPLARLALESRYTAHFAGLRASPQFRAAYESFERINRGLKQVITDWQTVEIGGSRIPNDHQDAAYDEAVIDKLVAVHEQLEPVLDSLARELPRLEAYKGKLEHALSASEDGEHEWISDARRESYHTVWFEFHEDLLRIMGCAREE